MKRIALPLFAALATASLAVAESNMPAPDAPDYEYKPPLADSAPDADGSVDEGTDLIGRGMDMLFRNLLNEVAPELDNMSRDMGEAMSLLGPAVSDLTSLVDDFQNYQRPERLENGDIIIRRKPGAPPPPEIGEGLRQFTEPRGDQLPDGDALPYDPDQPAIEL